VRREVKGGGRRFRVRGKDREKKVGEKKEEVNFMESRG
jgi:hypothetical protein